MPEVRFYPNCPVPEDEVIYAVIVARYQEKWVFCRHRNRDTWEIPGGHRELGETADDAARRELWEETGATDADIHAVGYYGYNKVGKLFYADIKKLGPLPKMSEIREICLMDRLPEALTYPNIQPFLYHRVQGWLNLQSNADEIWDVYDENRNLTGRTHRRGDFLRPGDYHLVVDIWMQNSTGAFLLTKRSPNKGFPNMWETTGGSALSGDDSLRAALREVREETGLSLDPQKGSCLLRYRGEDFHRDIWLFRQDFDLQEVALQEGETCGAMYASKEDILRMQDAGELVPYTYLNELVAML